MGAAPVAIALVGLVIPIVMFVGAVVFDVALVCWLLWHWRQERVPAPRPARRPIASRIAHFFAPPHTPVWK